MEGIIIAGNYEQYKFWLRDNKLNPKEYKFARSPEHLYGLHNIPLIYVGEWWLNPLVENGGVPHKEDYLQALKEDSWWMRKTEKHCFACHAVIECDSWKFCPYCGLQFDWENWECCIYEKDKEE